MHKWHPLLKSQVDELGIQESELEGKWLHLIELVSDSYQNMDNEKSIVKLKITCSSPRVLIVEDDPVNQAVAHEMLNVCNLESDIANHGIEAIEMLVINKYNLIFMDIHMPILDGIETTKIIREKESERGITKTSSEYIPIVALTANAFASDKQKCLKAGMDDYLSKPFQMEDLHNILKKYVPDLPYNE